MHRAPMCGGFAAAIPAVLVMLSNLAAAQPPPGAPKPAAPKAAPQAPAAAPPAAPAQGATAAQAPAPIEINDAMLTPVPPAQHMLTNWKEALQYITNRSIDVATAFQEIERAEGLRRQALALALPTINATGTINGQITPKVDPTIAKNPTITGSVTASMPILAPRAWYGIGTADMSVTSAKLSYDDKRRTVLTTVANSIVAVITAERVAEINRVGLRSALERLDLTQRKFRLGDATRLDVVRAEQDAATARATLVSGDESLRQARESLGLALGFNEAYGVPPGISLTDIESTVSGVCSAGKLEDRADVRQAKNDIEVAKRGITDAWLAFSPTITLSTTASISNSASLTTGSTGSWNIVGTLSIPLWEGGARYGAIRIAKANAEEAKIKLEATMRSANINVSQALRSVAVAEQSRAVSASARDLARESARLAQRAYEVGTGTSFDLVNTAQQERAAELDLAVKEFQVISARLSAVLAAANCTY